MLAAERFKAFDETRNIGMAALNDIKSSEIYNTVTNKLTEVTGELKAIASAVKQAVSTPLSAIKGVVDSALRTVRDTFSALQDLTGFSQRDLENYVGGFLPDVPGLSNAFRTLTSQCRDNAASRVPGFKNYNSNFGCGNNSSKCSSGEINNLLGKATGGLFNTVASALQSMLRSLITLGSIGYSAGACKIFSALINGLPNNIVQRGAAGLLALFGGEGNTTAVFDIAANMGNVNPSKEISGLTSRIADNFTIPSNYTGAALGDVYSGIADAFSSINPGYDVSEIDGIQTLANMGTGGNSNLSSAASAYLKSSQFSDYDTPIYSNDYSLAGAYSSSSSSYDPFGSLGYI